ncbi:unnamed protein product [Danaus chrysippus]|uniref:(African queen) hypothetical protein n=1 Tax=Danaus chrysippus TaxID=151541 RepID=A0A8J2QR03_9NEOP|nr:unnamed protein product [Danaus chrysippus]
MLVILAPLYTIYTNRRSWLTAIQCKEQGLTPNYLRYKGDIKHVAAFGDAAHRGPNWYDYTSRSSGESGSDLKSSLSSHSSSLADGSSSISTSQSSEASSLETTEKRLATKTYRVCTPCPHDMLKNYKNKGIKWICGGYQRARRSFKSDCMMRYRNCEDGTIEVTVSLIPNETKIENIKNDLRRSGKKKKKDRSTSSEEARGKDSDSADVDKESLELSTHELTSDTDASKRPVSSAERRGWRKWHRKCTPCPDDMVKKWRDPSIKWICGGYQRARRSFKSSCMMHYRNCQDGTMFVKIHDFRCANDTDLDHPHGEHFFYDYKVPLSDDSSNSATGDSSKDDSDDL